MTISTHFNLSALFATRQLALSDRQLTAVTGRLSSGIRLNRAADDPAGMVIANGLRHAREDADQSAANGEEGVSLLQAAEGAMDEMSSMLTRMRALAVHAGNAGTLDPGQRSALQSEFDELIASVDRIAVNTSFGGATLLDGSFADNEIDAGSRAAYARVDSDARRLVGGIARDSAISFGPPDGVLQRDRIAATFTGAPSGSTLLQGASQAGTALTGVGGATVTITGPKGSSALSLSSGTTIDDFVSLVNNASERTGARASYDEATGELVVESENFGPSGLAITSDDLSGGAGVGLLDSDVTGPLNAFAVAATTRTMNLTYVDAGGTTRTVALAQDGSVDGGLAFRSVTGGPETSGPYTGWNPDAFTVVMRDTSDGAIASTVAVPTAAGGARRASTSHLQMGGRAEHAVRFDLGDMRAAALGHGAGLANVGYADLASLVGRALIDGDADEALRVIDAAIDDVSGTRGRIGALQAHGIERGIDSLRTASVNLTSAESAIRDTDFARESAEFARVQIMHQAATAMLAQANQIPTSILSLLQR
ncbi:MAG TPA: flagellin [Planctomycetota bacterium]|nr:flagellin [Planctomycetota bacterium]